MIKLSRTNIESANSFGSSDIREAKIESTIFIDGPVDMSELAFKVHRSVAAALGDKSPRVERIIANGPATIVFWDDGEKTVVKCRECNVCNRKSDAPGPCCYRRYDSEKAVMAAMLKRLAPGWQDDVRKAEREVQ